jgi:endonuclease/exonuclease/phosphatase family metal-dependent hydrolase
MKNFSVECSLSIVWNLFATVWMATRKPALVVTAFFLPGANVLLAQESEVADASAMNVMTFNIRYNNQGDGENAWPHRAQLVGDLIRQHADIAGLQEARKEQIDDLQKQLGKDFEWRGVGRDDGKSGGEYVPIFVRRERFEIIDEGHFWLSKTPDVPGSKDWDAAITRMVTWLKLRDRKNDKSFYVFNTHFDHRGAQARLESGTLIRNQIRKIAGNEALLLTGDFNCRDDSEPYAEIVAEKNGDSEIADLNRLADSRGRSKAKYTGPNSTWSGFTKVEDGQRIDFIFTCGRWNVLEHHTNDKTFAGKFPSDHLCVYARVLLEMDALDK